MINKKEIEAVKEKIQTGEVRNEPLPYDAAIIQDKIELITTED